MATHLHCWAGYRDSLEWGSDAYWATFVDEASDGTCMLPAGHDGPHEWVPDADIGVSFAEQSDPATKVSP